MHTVTIMLSTYNGEKFLREQLDSIFSQSNIDLNLLVRDDGSLDNTISILEEYSKKYKNMTIFAEENCGCEESFKKLLQYAFNYCHTDFYAYADQDDVWYPNKLSISIASIINEKQPALFCCNQIVTDEKLQPFRKMIEDDNYIFIKKGMEINFFDNRHGCTMVWNNQLQNVLRNINHTYDYRIIHDKWVNLVARCAGVVVVSLEPLQYYRIHENNASGLASNTFERIKKGIKLHWIRKNNNSLYAKDCIRLLSDPKITSIGGKYVTLVSHYKENLYLRLKLAFSRQIWYNGFFEGLFRSFGVLKGNY